MKFTSTLFAAAATLVGSAVAAPGDCRPLRGGSTEPAPSPNTPEAFGAFKYYDDAAKTAVAPANYEAFLKAGHAAIHSDASYLTYKALSSYDVGSCARACDDSKECASCKSSSFVSITCTSVLKTLILEY